MSTLESGIEVGHLKQRGLKNKRNLISEGCDKQEGE